MPGRLQNKVAIVTGAASGIGRAIALAFHREGALVVCSDIQEVSRNEASDEPDTTTHALIEKEGGQSLFVKADVGSAADIEALVAATVEKFGRLDIMVNNAGIAAAGGPLPIWMASEEIWDTTMLINAKGVFLGCKYASAQMIKQDPHPSGDRGWIINMASICGMRGTAVITAYTASKHAVLGITKSVALDCASQGIHVNAICPGYTDTAMPAAALNNPEIAPRLLARHPFRGFGKPDDIAKAAVFLASEENSWITGVGLPVDGGYTAM